MKQFSGLLALAVFLLIGCATTTPYQKVGLMGGYTDHRIDANTFLVEFRGNGFTSQQIVEAYLLYRCAEVTASAGYDYFVIADGGVKPKQEVLTTTTPGEFSSSTSGTATTFGSATAFGNTATGSAITSGSAITTGTYTPPETSSTVVTRYRGAYRIKAFNGEKPAGDPNAYDAHEVIIFLGPSIK